MAEPSLRVEVFRTGTHQGDNGKLYSYTAEKVDQAIANFNPKKFRPPLIVTPSMDHNHRPYGDRELAASPLAHGVPSRLERVGDRVFAEFDKHSRHFAEWLEQGRIPGISAAFYGENHPSNPNPGEPTFRHFAGVLIPSVKGMELPGFSELIDGGAEELSPEMAAEFSEQSTITIVQALSRLRDWLIENQGREAADAIIPSLDLRSAIDQAADDNDIREFAIAAWRGVGDLQMRVNTLEYRVSEAESGETEEMFAEPATEPDAKSASASPDRDRVTDDVSVDTPSDSQPLTTTPDTPQDTMAENTVRIDYSTLIPAPASSESDAAELAAFAESQQRLAELEQQNQRLKEQLAELELKNTQAEVAAFCEPLPDELKQPIAIGEQSVSIAQFAESLDESNRSFLRGWIGEISKAIAPPEPTKEAVSPAPIDSAMFSEVTADADISLGVADVKDAVNFSEYDASSVAYANRVRSYAAQHGLSYIDASRAIGQP